MKDLISIQQQSIGTDLVQTVNARDLHAFLGVGKDFSNWVKDRIQQFGFVENRDFVCVEGLSSPDSASSKARQQITKEYFLALDMAKELSMVERTTKGKEARQYFIECERRLFAGEAAPTAKPQEIDADRAIKQYMVVLKTYKSSGVTLPTAVEYARQAMRDRGVDIDTILPMPASHYNRRNPNWHEILAQPLNGHGTLGNLILSATKGDQSAIQVLRDQGVVLLQSPGKVGGEGIFVARGYPGQDDIIARLYATVLDSGVERRVLLGITRYRGAQVPLSAIPLLH
ncbi:antA/AntB antirepressor family protein [Acidithiobacillus ferrooxidans]|uniref:antA/AntB antirepressor family protein n=1 Tax=Acidithiobacillus ferrooxidans TaxID=920 RepID=UPI00214CB9C2|nr:antA/AntB antirepressor family protein [Acidithiobacillus ferrooxidans]MCR2831002.1 antA/AntB antirepressor family protein [Acidithiobacillus ferrooxidans]